MDNPLVLYLVQKDKWKTRKKMKEKSTIMRIDKFLSNQGIGSRRDVRKLIQKGNVHINGTVIKKIDVKIDAIIDDIECDGQKVMYQSGVYLMLNKPKIVLQQLRINTIKWLWIILNIHKTSFISGGTIG